MIDKGIEDRVIHETPYYEKLHATYRDNANFTRYFSVLKRITRRDPFIEKLESNNGKELVYLGRRIFTLQGDFVSNYIKFLEDESQIDQWEHFFERYSKHIFNIYQDFVQGVSSNVVVFEIANRKLLRDILTRKLLAESAETKIAVSERFGAVVNQLFNYIRNSLTKRTVVVDNIIIDSYEHVPFVPKTSYFDMMKVLNPSFMKKGLPEPVFSAIMKGLVRYYYTDETKNIVDALGKLPSFNKKSIGEIFKSRFFFPDDSALTLIIDALQMRGRRLMADITEKKRSISEKMQNIRRKISETTNIMSDSLINLAEDFSTEEAIENMVKRLHRSVIGNAYDLKILKWEYQECLDRENNLKEIMRYKPADISGLVVKNEWDPYIMQVLHRNEKIGEDQLQLIIRDALNDLRSDEAAQQLMNQYRTPALLKEKYDSQLIIGKFAKIVDEIITPLVKCILLEELVDYYPKLSDMMTAEGIRYLGEEALSGRVSMIEKDVNIVPSEGPVSDVNVERYKNLVSVLVYDIRGSTFMGAKLKNAEKESAIRNLFQESMLYVAEKYGGIPVKDTGDGGVIFFAKNHYDIKDEKTLKPESGSMLPAVRCAIEMVQEAKLFVQRNLHRYHDWFREAEEREIDFEGATYATLPPSYQAIFQVGIGIASGHYPRELYLEKNAFGEYDLTGMLVREANLYSAVKAKGKSTVICDDATVYNILLNVERFSFLSEAGLRIDPVQLNIQQGLEYWIRQRATRKGFIFDLHKIFAAKFGREMADTDNLKIVLDDSDIVIDESTDIQLEKVERSKLLFEIHTEISR
ncbi:MAG: hypothetical protein OEV79_07695 [candidate division WOR-3 bacterium]|nr:hypothetical protein [candidate division WOR-3 bacterium]